MVGFVPVEDGTESSYRNADVLEVSAAVDVKVKFYSYIHYFRIITNAHLSL